MNPDEVSTQPPFELPGEPQPAVTNRTRIGGMLLVLAGVIGLLGAGLILTVDITQPSFSQLTDLGFTEDQIRSSILVCAAVEAILSIFPLLAGVFALQRRHKTMALAGGIIGIFSLGPVVFFAPALLSVAGVAFIVLARGEFID